MSFLENGTLRVGVDLTDGGKITYLSRISGSEAHDLLQDAQQSYYGGPLGDQWHVAGNGGTVVANRNDGRTIYTKVLPRRNEYSSQQCSCTIETWIKLDGNTVQVRNRLTELGSRGIGFLPHGQELPALYTTGDAYRLFTYDGDAPYTGAPASEITDDRGGFFTPGPSFAATEHWAALLDDRGFGVGLFEPRLTRFAGIPGNAYAVDYGWVNGYLSASTVEVLDSSPVYSYDYTLVVGTLDQIRSYAVDRRPDPRPRYLFRTDRQHWWELNATDAATPVRGALRLYPDHYDPQIYGPETFFSANTVRSLYVRGAWHTVQTRAELFWNPGGGFDGDHVTSFRVIGDGRFHTYRIPLAGVSGWAGVVHGLRLDFVDDRAEPGRWVDLSCISWKPCPRDRVGEQRSLRSKPAARFFDSFDSLNPSFWSAGSSPGTSVNPLGGRLEVRFDPEAQPDAGQAFVRAGVESVCRLSGDFDIRVDYRLADWPAANGVDIELAADSGQTVGRRNGTGENYFAAGLSGRLLAPTTDLAGSLRLVRQGGSDRGYYLHDGRWVLLWQANATAGRPQVSLAAWSPAGAYAQQEVEAYFDDFRVVRGGLSCP